MAEQQTSRRPERTFRLRGIRATVWPNPVKTEQGTVTKLSVTVEKRYKDRNSGDFKSGNTFFPEELGALRAVVDRALDYCMTRESEDVLD